MDQSPRSLRFVLSHTNGAGAEIQTRLAFALRVLLSCVGQTGFQLCVGGSSGFHIGGSSGFHILPVAQAGFQLCVGGSSGFHITERYRALQGAARRYKALQGATGRYKVLQGAARRLKALQGATGATAQGVAEGGGAPWTLLHLRPQHQKTLIAAWCCDL
jgi:hypothetical protein